MMEKGQLFICAEDLTWKKMFLLIALPITLTLSVWKWMMITENYLRISRKKLQSLTGDGELKLIKYGRVYLKIYVNDKGEMAPKFWEVFCEDGKSGSSEQRPKGRSKALSSKEYKKAIWDEESLLGKYIEGEVVFSIANIFVGKSQSIICVAKEILVKEVMAEKSYFGKYPVWRRS